MKKQVIDTVRNTLKDNTGLHVKNLLIGSEGTLGVITKVAISAAPEPKNLKVGVFGVASFEALRTLMRRAREELGEIVRALEYMDRNSYQVR